MEWLVGGTWRVGEGGAVGDATKVTWGPTGVPHTSQRATEDGGLVQAKGTFMGGEG